MTISPEIDRLLFTLADALEKCFGGFRMENGTYKVDCCGPVKYYSGLGVTDMAQCPTCKRAVCDALSPFVSPLLNSGCGTTSFPSDEFREAVGERHWMVAIPGEWPERTEA